MTRRKNAKSTVLDDAARYYCRMRGDVTAYGTGKIGQLLRAAADQGSLTASEIASLLDTREPPIEVETKVEIGD